MAQTLPDSNLFFPNLLPVWGKGLSPGLSDFGRAGSPFEEFLGERGCCSSSWWLVPKRRPGLQVRVLASSILALVTGSFMASGKHCGLSELFPSLTVETLN